MKRALVLMVLTAVVMFLSSIFIPPVTADKTKKSKRITAGDSSKKTESSSDQTTEAARQGAESDQEDPDLPPGARMDRETYLRLRDEYVLALRGIEPGKPFDPSARG